MSDADRTILLAHDKPDKRELYRRLLADAGDGWEVELASCGEQAVEIALSREVSCAVLDVLMPNTRKDEREGHFQQEGGIWALERIVEKKSYLPIILFSSREPDDETVENARRLGVFDYLVRDEAHFPIKFVTRVRNAAEAFSSRVKTLEKKSKILYKSGLMEAVIL
ncbi:MAG: response regulator, partial [Planctomycetota bacterium]